MSRFLENEREKERERERERNPRAIKRSYGELGQFLDWPEPVQERRNERKRSPIIHEAMSSALSVIVHIFVASALSLTGMADVQLSPYEPPKSQFRLFVKAIEFGRCCSNSSSRSPRFRDTDTRVHTTSRSNWAEFSSSFVSRRADPNPRMNLNLHAKGASFVSTRF